MARTRPGRLADRARSRRRRCGSCADRPPRSSPPSRPSPRSRCRLRPGSRARLHGGRMCGAQTTPRRWPAVCRFMSVTRARQSQPALRAAALRARRASAAERLVGLRRIARAAGGIDVSRKRLRDRRIEHVAGLLESGESVGIEHLRPHVAVVGRRIAVAGEDMPEVRAAGGASTISSGMAMLRQRLARRRWRRSPPGEESVCRSRSAMAEASILGP